MDTRVIIRKFDMDGAVSGAMYTYMTGHMPLRERKWTSPFTKIGDNGLANREQKEIQPKECEKYHKETRAQ